MFHLIVGPFHEWLSANGDTYKKKFHDQQWHTTRLGLTQSRKPTGATGVIIIKVITHIQKAWQTMLPLKSS
jgi:hypothetical protein